MTEEMLRKRVVNCARQYEGCSEQNGTHRKILDVYNNHRPLAREYQLSTTDPWCAAFVSVVAIVSQLTELMPLECSCSAMVSLYQKRGRWQEKDDYVPRMGDVIFYDWGDNGNGDNVGSPDHVGIVTQVTGDSMVVIEGNLNHQVGYRKLKCNDRYIRGYGLPDYQRLTTGVSQPAEPESEKLTDPVLPMLKKGAKGNTVCAMQILLIGYGFSCGSWGADGDFGSGTEKALMAYQREKGLEVDGICGPLTWARLLGVESIER